jgi:hypothetical protein
MANAHSFKKKMCTHAIGFLQNVTKLKTVITGNEFEGSTHPVKSVFRFIFMSLFSLHGLMRCMHQVLFMFESISKVLQLVE